MQGEETREENTSIVTTENHGLERRKGKAGEDAGGDRYASINQDRNRDILA